MSSSVPKKSNHESNIYCKCLAIKCVCIFHSNALRFCMMAAICHPAIWRCDPAVLEGHLLFSGITNLERKCLECLSVCQLSSENIPPVEWKHYHPFRGYRRLLKWGSFSGKCLPRLGTKDWRDVPNFQWVVVGKSRGVQIHAKPRQMDCPQNWQMTLTCSLLCCISCSLCFHVFAFQRGAFTLFPAEFIDPHMTHVCAYPLDTRIGIVL